MVWLRGLNQQQILSTAPYAKCACYLLETLFPTDNMDLKEISDHIVITRLSNYILVRFFIS